MVNSYFINKYANELKRIEQQLKYKPHVNDQTQMPVGHLMLLAEQKRLRGRIERESKAGGVKNPLLSDNNDYGTSINSKPTISATAENKKFRGTTSTTGIVDNFPRVTTLKGGPKLSFAIKNKNIKNTSPLDYYLTSYPLDEHGNRITTISAPPKSEFLNLLPATTYRGYHDAGDIGDSYIHNLRVVPNTAATAAKFFIFIDLEASY